MTQPRPKTITVTVGLTPTTMITLYDIPSTLPDKTWSPNVWKTRYTLNYKGLPYQTTWVEFPDIAATAIALNAKAPIALHDGKPYYTLPMIHDSATDTVVMDSFAIAQYLDAAYPDTPRVVPADLIGLIKAFGDVAPTHMTAFMPLQMPLSARFLNPSSKEYYSRSRGRLFRVPNLEDAYPSDELRPAIWKKVEQGFEKILTYYAEPGNVFITGERPLFVDFQVAAIVLRCRMLWGEKSEEWNAIASWHNGHWGNVVKALEEYETVL